MMEMTGSRGELLDGVQQLPRVWANMIRFDEDCHYSNSTTTLIRRVVNLRSRRQGRTVSDNTRNHVSIILIQLF